MSYLTTEPHNEKVGKRKIHPLRDGIFAALGVLICFTISAWWIHHQAWETEVGHNEETVMTTARRAAATVDPAVLIVEFPAPRPATPRQTLMDDLEAIDAECSPVARVTVLKSIKGVYRILYDTKNPKHRNGWKDPQTAKILNPEETEIVDGVMRTGVERNVSQGNGVMKSYVPIGSKSGEVMGVATAESTAETLEVGFGAIIRAVWSAVLIGAAVALLVCAVVYSLRRKARQAMEQLAFSERADRLVLSAMGQIFYEWDPVTDEIRWRGDVEGLLGVAPESIASGTAWIERIHNADRDEFLGSRNLKGETESHFRKEYRVHCHDGKFIWVLDRGSCLPRDEDHPAFSIGVILNMTASREAEQRLRDVVDAAGEYIWEVDATGRYTYLSERVREVLGRTPEDMLGAEPLDYVLAEDLEDVRNASAVLVSKQRAFRDFEHRILRADGKAIWLCVNGVPSFDANGNWSGYRGAGLEVTARKEAEQALIQEKEAANAAVQAKSQFLAMMSHEIRTPLNSVLGFADLLSATLLDHNQREQVDLIRKSGDALLVLLNDILDFSRIESEGLALDVNDVDLRASLQDVIDLYRLVASQRGINLTLDVTPDVPKLLRTDQARLRQIFLNLVGNAVKFTEKGSVTVRATLQGRLPDGRAAILIEVVDTGIGIPKDKIPSLFHPFVQVDASATRRFGGTGLGLAICRRLAELLGGEVGLKESDESGSTFYLDLNAAISESEELAARPTAALREPSWRPNGQKECRILVVEDNRVNRLLVRKMLSAVGVTSEEAENGLECLEMQAAAPYDLILMDVQMPVLDGLEASRRIRRCEHSHPENPRTTIVALTAEAMIGDRERCLAAGMDDYLSKPIRMEAMVAILERYDVIACEGPVSEDPDKPAV